MKEFAIVLAVVLVMFVLLSVLLMVALYWTRYPYGRSKKWRRKK